MPAQLHLAYVIAAPTAVATLAANVIVPQESAASHPDSTSTQAGTDNYSIILTVDAFTVAAFAVLVVLAAIGGVYLYKLATQQKCSCPICLKQYEIVKRLGTGGYGTVLEVRRSSGDLLTGKRRAAARRNGARSRAASSDGEAPPSENSHTGERFVIKMIPCVTLSDASAAQQEAKCVVVSPSGVS
jgi:hypothetical protein